MADQLVIYNSLSRQKEVFKPVTEGKVGLYVCGPTVYNEVHLGNMRSFTSFDVVFRYLKYLGYQVRYVRNITDAGHLESDEGVGEDKIEKYARANKIEPMEVVQKFTNSFHEVCTMLNLLPPSIEPTATGHVVEQIEWTKRIIERGYAYESNGTVYLDVLKYNEDFPYGELSGRVLEELKSNSRELTGGDDKKNPFDFAIWISAPENHIMQWPSPWGQGHLGWHLECSVMSTKYLGVPFDIHGGGMDLKFPHHEAEIAQCRAMHGVEPCNYWMHGNMLTLNGKKMSKSDGNTFMPRELFSGDHPKLERGYHPMVIRFFMLMTHYRSTLDFSTDALDAADKGFHRLANAYKVLEGLTYVKGNVDTAENEEVLHLCAQCHAHMNDDFSTAETIARLFDLSKKINAYNDGKIAIGTIEASTFKTLQDTFFDFFNLVLGLQTPAADNDATLNGVMDLLLDIRQNARTTKDWGTSDKIRDALAALKIKVKDGAEGSSWSVE